MVKKIQWLMLGLLGSILVFGCGQADIQEIQTREEIVMVPMQDGVRLATSTFLPAGDGPWPALLMRTPYDRKTDTSIAVDLTNLGVAVVLQDMRGYHDSMGLVSGFFSDQEDGHATLNWIAAQPWSNGRVATFGGSALGIAQYLLAPGANDSLRCQWVEVATPDVYGEAVFQGGVYRDELAIQWMEGNFSSHLIEPFKAHPLNTDYWEAVQITDEYDAINVPAMHVSGWHDIFARGTIAAFLGYQNQGGEGAVGQQHLIMGPWTHDINSSIVGELTYPDAVLEDYDAWQETWLNACLFKDRQAQKEVDSLPVVQYFSMGAVGEDGAPGNIWQTAETWPPSGATNLILYLNANGLLGRHPPDIGGGGDTFLYDPSNPVPTIGGANLHLEAGAFDQRAIETREDVLVYTTSWLHEPLEVTGNLQAFIWMVTNVPDTDIIVRLTDVYPDGRSMLVAEGILRARYHDSPNFTSWEFLEPGRPYRLSIDLGPTSIVFNTDHRIRISITSSSVPRFLPNPNTGAMYLGPGETGWIAHTSILHNAQYPSVIILPVMENQP